MLFARYESFTVRNGQRGNATLFAILSAVVLTSAIFTLSNKLRLASQNQQGKKSRIDTRLSLESGVSRLEPLITDDSNMCGQPVGNCPGVFPDPVECEAGKPANFVKFAEGQDWDFKRGTILNNHFKVDEGSYAAPLDASNLPRQSGDLGEFWFDYSKYGQLSQASSTLLMTQSYLSTMATNLAFASPQNKVIAAIEGYECSKAGFVSAAYLHSRLQEVGVGDPEYNVRLNIQFGPPTCQLSLSKYADVKEGDRVSGSLVAFGVWTDSLSPAATRNSNSSKTHSITAADVVWEGLSQPLVVASACYPYASVQGQVVGPSGAWQSCSAQVHVNVSQARIDAECTPLITPGSPSYNPVLYEYYEKKVEEAPKVKSCPGPYFITRRGKKMKMVYIVVNGECAAVAAEVDEI